jgi:hypothetical protein
LLVNDPVDASHDGSVQVATRVMSVLGLTVGAVNQPDHPLGVI